MAIHDRSGSNDHSGEGLRARSRRGRIGRTWWSERWIRVLETIGLGDRLHRGRTLARAGSVLSLSIESGEANAEVMGNRQEIFQVKIGMEPIPSEAWTTLEGILARRALFAARLLSGDIPVQIEVAFAEAGLSLFPARPGELEADCTCPDPARPCPHAAAVFYLIAERFDEDPFELFRFRGRGRAELIAGITGSDESGAAKARSDASGAAPAFPDGDANAISDGSGAARAVLDESGAAKAPSDQSGDAPALSDGISASQAFSDGSDVDQSLSDETGATRALSDGSGDAPAFRNGSGAARPVSDGAGVEAATPAESAFEVLEGFWELRGELESLEPRIHPPPIPQAVLRRLGPPPGAGHDSPAEAALFRAYQIASAWALKTAMKPE